MPALFSPIHVITIGFYYVVGLTSPVFRQFDLLYILLASSYMMVACLLISLFYLIWDLSLSKGRNILRPFHVLGPIQLHDRYSPRALIFGSFLFRKRYKYVLCCFNSVGT